MILGVAVFHVVTSRIVRNIYVPVLFIVRCYLAALPTAALALAAARWSGPAALALEIAAGVLLLVVCFRFLRVMGPRERELIERLPIPLKGAILKLL